MLRALDAVRRVVKVDNDDDGWNASVKVVVITSRVIMRAMHEYLLVDDCIFYFCVLMYTLAGYYSSHNPT